MEKQNPNNSEILLLPAPKAKAEKIIDEPYKMDTFDAYVLWKSIPVLLKKPPTPSGGIRPSARAFAESQGIDDEDVLRLIEIPTQSAFADEFGVHMDTLSNWNKTIKERDTLTDTKKWARGLMNNLVMSMYSHAMKKGNPLTFKLFFQVVGDFQEKAIVDHKFIPITSIKFVEHGESTDAQ